MKNKQFALRFIIICLIFALSGCASRKVDRKEQKQKIDFAEQITSETKTRAEITSVTVDTSTIDEIEIVPIDSTKPIIYNNHKVYNGTLKLSKRKNNITTNKVEKVAEIQRKQAKRELKLDNSNKEKETERKSGFNWWWLLLLIPIYLIYRQWK